MSATSASTRMRSRATCRPIGRPPSRASPMHHTALLLGAAVAAVAIATAPSASAAPSGSCLQTAAACQGAAANVQIVASPQAIPRLYPTTTNPKWHGVGYNPRWPALGHSPKWQDFGYNPRAQGQRVHVRGRRLLPPLQRDPLRPCRFPLPTCELHHVHSAREREDLAVLDVVNATVATV